MTTLTGTEKQIRYAESLLAEARSERDYYEKKLKHRQGLSCYADKPERLAPMQADIEKADENLKMVESISDASIVIAILRDTQILEIQTPKK